MDADIIEIAEIDAPDGGRQIVSWSTADGLLRVDGETDPNGAKYGTEAEARKATHELYIDWGITWIEAD